MLLELKLELKETIFFFNVQFHGVSLQEIIRDWQYDWLYEKYSDYFSDVEVESEEDPDNTIDSN